MKTIWALPILVLTALCHIGFTLNDTLPKKLPELNGEALNKIKSFHMGVRYSFFFKSLGLNIGETILGLKNSKITRDPSQVKLLGNKKLRNIVLQQDMGNEEMNYILKCRRKKC